MAPAAVEISASNGSTRGSLKPNIGVYTNPKHDLWVNEAAPTADSVAVGADLKPGEVTIAIRSTGICGYENIDVFNLFSRPFSITDERSFHLPVPTFTSGTLAVSGPWWSRGTTSSATSRPAT